MTIGTAVTTGETGMHATIARKRREITEVSTKRTMMSPLEMIVGIGKTATATIAATIAARNGRRGAFLVQTAMLLWLPTSRTQVMGKRISSHRISGENVISRVREGG